MNNLNSVLLEGNLIDIPSFNKPAGVSICNFIIAVYFAQIVTQKNNWKNGKEDNLIETLREAFKVANELSKNIP